MNDQQNMVIATLVAGLILVVVFLCPWRIESSGEIRWSPVYQAPLSYQKSLKADDAAQGSSEIEAEEAHIMYGYLALEVVALILAGGGLYVFFSGSANKKRKP